MTAILLLLTSLAATAKPNRSQFCLNCLKSPPKHHYGTKVNGCECPCRLMHQNRND